MYQLGAGSVNVIRDGGKNKTVAVAASATTTTVCVCVGEEGEECVLNSAIFQLLLLDAMRLSACLPACARTDEIKMNAAAAVFLFPFYRFMFSFLPFASKDTTHIVCVCVR